MLLPIKIPMALERLQKIISRAGVASRRKAEELILEGRVTVNGQAVRELGSKADLSTDHVKVDGKLLRPPSQQVYLALHKPRGYVTTLLDPEGRPTVKDLLKKVTERVYPVGRLDYNSEGLLLLTNDGEFANRLTSSASGILKTYWVKVKGLPQEKHIEKLREGVLLDGRKTLPAQIRLLRTTAEGSSLAARRRREMAEGRGGRRTAPQQPGREPSANRWYEVMITEGRQNQVRRMFELIGHPVQKLKRVRIGPVSLGSLPAGRLRALTPGEMRSLLGKKTWSH